MKITREFLRAEGCCYYQEEHGEERVNALVPLDGLSALEVARLPISVEDRIWALTHAGALPDRVRWEWLRRLVERALRVDGRADPRSQDIVPLLARLAEGEIIPQSALDAASDAAMDAASDAARAASAARAAARAAASAAAWAAWAASAASAAASAAASDAAWAASAASAAARAARDAAWAASAARAAARAASDAACDAAWAASAASDAARDAASDAARAALDAEKSRQIEDLIELLSEEVRP
jgi:hypothetical protein